MRKLKLGENMKKIGWIILWVAYTVTGVYVMTQAQTAVTYTKGTDANGNPVSIQTATLTKPFSFTQLQTQALQMQISIINLPN